MKPFGRLVKWRAALRWPSDREVGQQPENMHTVCGRPAVPSFECIDCDLALAHLEHVGKRRAGSLPGAHHTLAVSLGIAQPRTNNHPAVHGKRKKGAQENSGRCTVETGEEIDRLFSEHISNPPCDGYGLRLPVPPGGNLGSPHKPPSNRTRSLLRAGLDALKERGIVLWASQVALPCEHLGCAPVLDLLGFVPERGHLVIVEVKTSGSAAFRKAKLGPDIRVPVRYHTGDLVNMCVSDTWSHRHLLQLSLQCHCANSVLGRERGVPLPPVEGLLLVLSGYSHATVKPLPKDYQNIAWDVLLSAQN